MFLDDAQSAITAVAETAGASIVGVGHRWAVGSGVVIGDGRILTNAHNLRGDEVQVALPSGETAVGRPIGVDVDGDLAVVETDTDGTTAIEWPRNGSVAIGAPVFALANPGGRGLRVTFGFVSGTERSFRGPRGRRITGSIEHTSPLLPGSSGGPIVDGSGRLLGLNTNRLGEGFYLAIPADDGLRSRAEALGRGDAPGRPRLGIGIASSEVARDLRRAVGLPETQGLLVRVVDGEGPAAASGLAEGDLIVRADGRALADADDLHEALESAGEAVELEVIRGTEQRTVSVPLDRGGAKPER
ncbi:MAG: S1C family serine protease [Actinomycetota bacterium]